MARRHRPLESTYPNRWMVSYADLMTLLFAFFVVLFASSSIDRDKFKKMSEVFVGVFEQPSDITIPKNMNTLIQDLSNSFLPEKDIPQETVENQTRLLSQLIEITTNTLGISAPQLNQTYDFLQLTLPADKFFKPQSEDINLIGNDFLIAFSKLVKQTDRFILIEVFTDDQVNDKSPWLLSAKQGMAIKELLMLESVSPMHIASVNYGPFQPIATNDDEQGQAINRRVNFVIYPNLQHLNRLMTMAKEQKPAKPNK